jgi:hypothetical protein
MQQTTSQVSTCKQAGHLTQQCASESRCRPHVLYANPELHAPALATAYLDSTALHATLLVHPPVLPPLTSVMVLNSVSPNDVSRDSSALGCMPYTTGLSAGSEFSMYCCSVSKLLGRGALKPGASSSAGVPQLEGSTSWPDGRISGRISTCNSHCKGA